jgi:hypothetical protein
MGTFESVAVVEGKARKELLETIVKNQTEAQKRYEEDRANQDKRTRALEVKFAVGVGLIIATKAALELVPILLHKL